MNKKRISEVEDSGPNPAMSFLPVFEICKDGAVHGNYTFKNVNDVGAKGVELVEAVLKIEGVKTLSISKYELRVFKHRAFEWCEIAPAVRSAFKEIFGTDIEFVTENVITLRIKRLKTTFDMTPKPSNK